MDEEISEKIRNMLKELGWSDETIHQSEFFTSDAEPENLEVQAAAKDPKKNRR